MVHKLRQWSHSIKARSAVAWLLPLSAGLFVALNAQLAVALAARAADAGAAAAPSHHGRILFLAAIAVLLGLISGWPRRQTAGPAS